MISRNETLLRVKLGPLGDQSTKPYPVSKTLSLSLSLSFRLVFAWFVRLHAGVDRESFSLPLLLLLLLVSLLQYNSYMSTVFFVDTFSFSFFTILSSQISNRTLEDLMSEPWLSGLSGSLQVDS